MVSGGCCACCAPVTFESMSYAHNDFDCILCIVASAASSLNGGSVLSSFVGAGVAVVADEVQSCLYAVPTCKVLAGICKCSVIELTIETISKATTGPCLDQHEGLFGSIIDHDQVIGVEKTLSAYRPIFWYPRENLAGANLQLCLSMAQAVNG